MFSRLFTSFLMVAALSMCMSAQSIDEIRRNFVTPPDDARIMMRWWWFGPSVERDEIDRELEAMAAAGLGGAEVAFVYPMGPVTAPFHYRLTLSVVTTPTPPKPLMTHLPRLRATLNLS